MDIGATIARKCDAMVSNLNNAMRPAVTAASVTITTAQRATISAATGGRNFLSGVGAKGAKVSVGFDVQGSQHIVSLGRARGPLHLIERDTAGGALIKPKSRRGFKAVAGGPNGPFAHVTKGPTRGKHPFEHGFEAGAPAANSILERALSTAVIRGFKS